MVDMKVVMDLSDRLLVNGYKCYAVGGYVRDKLMHRKPKDVDLVTDARPKDVEKIFSPESGYYTFPVGMNYGTMGVIHEETKEQFEVTTMRKDTVCHGRSCEVEFTDDLLTDLSRRDFTMNSMALDLVTKEIIDPFDGESDVKTKVIRAVGNPFNRFEEDYLRILRACRFTALDNDMEIEETTKRDMKDLSYMVPKVSVERIKMELFKGMSYPVPSNMIRTMDSIGLLEMILPEVHALKGVEQNTWHSVFECQECGKLWEKTVSDDFVGFVPVKQRRRYVL